MKNTRNSYTVGVKLLSGKSFSVTIQPTDTVAALKQRIFEREGIPPQRQNLLVMGKLLQPDTRDLKEYNLKAGDMVYVTAGVRGGGETPTFPERHMDGREPLEYSAVDNIPVPGPSGIVAVGVYQSKTPHRATPTLAVVTEFKQPDGTTYLETANLSKAYDQPLTHSAAAIVRRERGVGFEVRMNVTNNEHKAVAAEVLALAQVPIYELADKPETENAIAQAVIEKVPCFLMTFPVTAEVKKSSTNQSGLSSAFVDEKGNRAAVILFPSIETKEEASAPRKQDGTSTQPKLVLSAALVPVHYLQDLEAKEVQLNDQLCKILMKHDAKLERQIEAAKKDGADPSRIQSVQKQRRALELLIDQSVDQAVTKLIRGEHEVAVVRFKEERDNILSKILEDVKSKNYDFSKDIPARVAAAAPASSVVSAADAKSAAPAKDSGGVVASGASASSAPPVVPAASVSAVLSVTSVSATLWPAPASQQQASAASSAAAASAAAAPTRSSS